MRIPAPSDSSKLVLLRVCLDFLLCVSQSVGVAVRGPHSFFPLAVTLLLLPSDAPRVSAAWVVYASSATLPGLPTKAGLLSDFFSRCGPFGLLAQASALQRRSEGDG